MKKETLIDFTTWFLKNSTRNYNPKRLPESIVDEYLKSINEASSESQSVSDNVGEKKTCDSCKHKNLQYDESPCNKCYSHEYWIKSTRRKA